MANVQPAWYVFSVVCMSALDMCRHVYSSVGVWDAPGWCWSADCHSGVYGMERLLSLPRTIFCIVMNMVCRRFARSIGLWELAKFFWPGRYPL